MLINKKPVFLFITLFIFSSSISATSIFKGSKTITIVGKNDEAIEIASIQFQQKDNKVTYKLEFKDDKFSDEFLSMRPFKCIHVAGQMLCHLVYPYQKQGYITEQDLVDLEYDLLFLHKDATEYGIDPWNGLYYDLKIEKNGLVGILKEVDLNILAAPPEDDILRPITKDLLYDADPQHHLFPTLTIQ